MVLPESEVSRKVNVEATKGAEGVALGREAESTFLSDLYWI
jgi:hypothetical protein